MTVTTTMRRTNAATLATVLAALALAFSASSANAHDELLSTAPADGARLTEAPDAVTLRFSARLDARMARVAVTDADGAPVPSGTATVDGAWLTLPVAISTPGRYTVAYRVVSRDGHPVSGTTAFTVTASPPASPSPVTPTASPTAVTDEDPSPAPASSPDTAPANLAAGVPGWWWIAAGLAAAAIIVVTVSAMPARRRR